jgi:predicted nuclease of restriction endonuclease-like (RecB) superfamily
MSEHIDPSFSEVVHLIQSARQRAFQAVNTVLIDLYWQVGEYISRKIADEAWGKAVIQQLAKHLQCTNPDLRGFSAQNLWRMRQFYEAYQEAPILSALLRELPWTHNLSILGKCKRPEEREFYLRLAARE